MSLLAQIDRLSETDKSTAVRKLITESTPDFNFFLLVVLSILMATFGLLVDSAATVIGSMLIAPILSPILSLSLGLVMSDIKLLMRSFYTIAKASAFGIASAMVATFLFSWQGTDGLTQYEVLSRTEPSLIYLFIAIIAGFAVAYTLVNPNLNATLPGIAIAVALMPPLSVVGIGIANANWVVATGAFNMYIINIVGIILASMVSFSLMDLYGKKKVANTTIKKEEKRLEDEQKHAEKFKEKAQNGD